MNNATSSLMTLDELCQALMISRSTAYKLLASGELPCFKMGRMWRIPRDGVDLYIRKQSKQP